MKTYLIPILLTTFIFVACNTPTRQVVESQSEAIKVDSSFNAIQDSSYLAQLEPIRNAKDSIMNQVIGSAPEPLVRFRPESNLINWSADALLDIARKLTKQTVDAAVVNVGGLRCDIPQGDITVGTIFSLMPFNNELVILTMQGSDIVELCNTFALRGGEGVSGIRMTINGNQAEDITINGKPIVPEAVYYIATSDYLSTGTDEMVAFTKALDKQFTYQVIRDLYIDYIKEKKIMRAAVDGRMNKK